MSWLVLDASRYQTFTDYTAAAAALDGVILRCGIRGYSTGALSKDSKLDTHYNGFFGKSSRDDISLRIGFYWYTCAISDEEAVEEAQYIHNIIGTKLNDFPVFINSDYATEDHDGRADHISVEERTQYLITLTGTLKDLGYRAGLYCTENWYNTKLDSTILDDHNLCLWIASNTEPEISNYDAWRYTDSGYISGISSRVSLSNFYRDVANWEDSRININTLTPWIISPVTYNGTLITPTEVGIDGLTYLVDYTVEYCNAAAASKLPYALLEGIGKYTGTKSVPYVIEPAEIYNLDIQLTQTGYKYTGSEIKPKITHDTSTTLGKAFSSSQYNIEYSDNIYPGEATVVVTGKNNFKGSVTLHFYIDGKIPFPTQPRLEASEYTYTGEVIQPKVIIGSLEEDRDFVVYYEDNINAGTGKVFITGINNYDGDSDEIEFIITPFNLATTSNVRYKALSYKYTGSIIEPEFSLSASKGDLIYSPLALQDYTYQYSNNINAGTGTLKIVGIGNYSGTYYSYFQIDPAPMDDCIVHIEEDKYEYTGAPIEPEVFVDYNGHSMGHNNFTIVYANNIKVGTNASITVIGRGNLTGQYKLSFEITTKTDKDFWMLDVAEFDYDSTAHEPEPICMTDDPVKGRDYTVEYENNINAGMGKVIVTMIGNYTYAKVYLYFTIRPKELDPDSFYIEETEFYYNRTYITPKLICTNEEYILGENYKYSYYNNKYPAEDTYVKVKGIGNYKGDLKYPFTIKRVPIDELAYIDMGEPVKYDIYDMKNFAVKLTSDDTKLVIYDDYIYDFKTITFEKNITYNYTVYIVTGIGPCTGTIVRGFRTSIDGVEPEIPSYIPIENQEEEIISEEIPEDIDVPIIIPDEEEPEEIIVPPVYIDPYKKSDKWVPDVNPIIPEDPEDVQYNSGEFIYVRKCGYYSSAYTKYPEVELLHGTYYVYEYKQVNGRIRVTLDPHNAKIVGRTTGWIKLEDIKNLIRVKVGDTVIVDDYMWYDKDTQTSRIFENGKELFVVEIDPDIRRTSDVGIGLSTKENLSTVGWVSLDMISLPETTE